MRRLLSWPLHWEGSQQPQIQYAQTGLPVTHLFPTPGSPKVLKSIFYFFFFLFILYFLFFSLLPYILKDGRFHRLKRLHSRLLLPPLVQVTVPSSLGDLLAGPPASHLASLWLPQWSLEYGNGVNPFHDQGSLVVSLCSQNKALPPFIRSYLGLIAAFPSLLSWPLNIF